MATISPLFNYISLLDAIPPKWCNLLKKNTILQINPIEEMVFISLNKTEMPVSILKARQVYWFLNKFKIIHWVFGTDSYVSNFDPSVSKISIHCLVDNNIPHLFVDCIKVCEFWQHFKTWLNNVEGYAINVSATDVIFSIHTSLITLPSAFEM